MKDLLKNNIAGIIAILLIIAYGIWFIWFQPKPTPTEGFVQTKPAVDTPKVSGPILKPPIKIVPKKEVEDEFPEAQIADNEEWVDTADIPPAPNGAIVLTKIDTVTGEVSSQVKNKEAPWFAFEAVNYLGAGVELHLDGERKGKIYYKRDFLRIKDIHLQGEVEGKVNRTLDKGEGFVGANVELRF